MLYNLRYLEGCSIGASDGTIGDVEDLYFDDVSWLESKVFVNLSRQAVRDAPLYDAAAPPDRGQEMSMYRHHRRAGYWEDAAKRAAGHEGNPMQQMRI